MRKGEAGTGRAIIAAGARLHRVARCLGGNPGTAQQVVLPQRATLMAMLSLWVPTAPTTTSLPTT